MTINYLQILRDNPKLSKNIMRGMTLTEITQLEQAWNNGNPFPKVLKELLF